MTLIFLQPRRATLGAPFTYLERVHTSLKNFLGRLKVKNPKKIHTFEGFEHDILIDEYLKKFIFQTFRCVACDLRVV